MSTPPDDPWAASAATWDDDPIVAAYASAAFDALQRALPLHAEARVLDFGAGTGVLTEKVAPHVHDVVAVDASPAMIDVLQAKPLPNVRAAVGRWDPDTLDDDPLATGPFDLILCSSVLAFIDPYPATLAMLAGLLAPGGHLVQWDWELDADAEEPFGLSRQAITRAMADAGLDGIRVDTAFEVPVEGAVMRPLMGIGRRLGG